MSGLTVTSRDWEQSEGIERRYWSGLQSILHRDSQNITPTRGGGMRTDNGPWSNRVVIWAGRTLTVSSANRPGETTTFRIPSDDHILRLKAKRATVLLWYALDGMTGDELAEHGWRAHTHEWCGYETRTFHADHHKDVW